MSMMHMISEFANDFLFILTLVVEMSSTAVNDKGGFAQVIPAYEATLQEQRSSLGDFSVDAIPATERLAACYSEVGAFDKALMLNEECLKKLQLVNGDNHPFTLSKIIKVTNDNATTSQTCDLVVKPLIVDNSKKPPPTIRFIDFESLKQRASFPRYPKDKGVNNATGSYGGDNTGLVVELSSIDRSDALLVFVSHCWLRGYEGAPGFDKAVGFHPDNATHDKFKLSLEGIEKTMKTMAPGARKCYIWFDFISLDQEGDPAAELDELDKIFESCDCAFTPIHDENSNIDKAASPNNSYGDYQAAAWNEGPYSYTHRSWTRLEMLYAANVPLIEDKTRAKRLFKHGFKDHMLNGVRPHLLYGTSESEGGRFPIILPPLQNSYYKILDPLDFDGKANLSNKSDRPKIRKLYEKVEMYFKKVDGGYEGGRDEYGIPNGKGVFHYADGTRHEGGFVDGKPHGKGFSSLANGDIYVGDFVDGRQHGKGVSILGSGSMYEGDYIDGAPHGKGVFSFASGDRYAGDFVNGYYHGVGAFSFANGDRYEGGYINGKSCGKGVHSIANGDRYEGDFVDDKYNGKGVFSTIDGDVYKGDFVDDKRHGKGVLSFADENRYEGDFVDGNPRGKGVYCSAIGNRYEGDFVDSKYQGKGVLIFADGSTYEGDFVDGRPHGKGISCLASGDRYEGDFMDDKLHGKGVLSFATGDMYEGDFVDAKQHGKGVFSFATGDIYEGDFVDAKLRGKGIYSFADGDMYEGDFVDAKQHGKGVFIWTHGNYFQGSFVDGKMYIGHMHLADVDLKLVAKFSGGDEILDGQRLYHLVLTNADSSVYKEGEFSKGKFVHV